VRRIALVSSRSGQATTRQGKDLITSMQISGMFPEPSAPHKQSFYLLARRPSVRSGSKRNPWNISRCSSNEHHCQQCTVSSSRPRLDFCAVCLRTRGSAVWHNTVCTSESCSNDLATASLPPRADDHILLTATSRPLHRQMTSSYPGRHGKVSHLFRDLILECPSCSHPGSPGSAVCPEQEVPCHGWELLKKISSASNSHHT
jgi:hypothetical protein